MASSDTKSGFRLPWNSDRSPNDAAPEGAQATPEGAAESAPAGLEWPDTTIDARLGNNTNGQQRPTQESAPDAAATDAAATQTQVPEESQRMVEIDVPSAPAAAPRKPTKLMADLSAAIRATAEAARDQAMQQLDADAAQVTEKIREGATEGGAALRKRSEDDVAGIRDWSKAEIARIREETDNRIATRKQVLEGELASHADAVNNRVEEVQSEVDRFKADMEEYFDRLSNEEDPSRLATMVEAMPDAPSFDAWADLGEAEDVVSEAEAPVEDAYVAADAVAESEPVEAVEAVEAVAETFEQSAPADDAEQVVAEDAVAEAAVAEEVSDVAADEAGQVVAEAAAEPETSNDDAKPSTKAVAWGEGDGDWRGSGDAPATPDDGSAVWATGEVPEGFPAGAEGGEAVDRGAIMAALEAAAEAVVAAEAAADSADQAEAAADVAETAAELVVGRNAGEEGSLDPEAQAALDARVDAGGFEGSYTDRLAHLLPSTPEAGADAEPKTTQVVVSGLVSVASIASFKRHLGRLSGVKAVAVASGPEGEFVFNVTHRPDVSFRDAIPSMQGFAARVTGQSEGVIQVTARDPEIRELIVESLAGHPAVAVFLPPTERELVAEELREGGFDPIVVHGPDELEGVLATRRDLVVALIDLGSDYDTGSACWSLLHAGGRNVPSLLVVDTASLDRIDVEAPGHENDEYLLRPYTAESIRWQIEAMCIRSVAVDDGSGPILQGSIGQVEWGHRGQLLLVFNPKGGVGKTMVSTNLAAALVARGQRVLLVDADTVTGHVPTSLGMDAVPTVIDAWRDEMDGGPMLTFGEMASVHSSGLKVLPLSAHPLNTELLEPQRVAGAIAVARRSFDFVIIDLHPSYSPLNRAIFDRADRILVPVTPDLPAIRAVVKLREIADELGMRDRLSLIVNRANSGIKVDDLERAIGMPTYAQVRSSGLLLVKASNEGRTLTEIAPKEKITQDFAHMADRLLGIQPVEVPKPQMNMFRRATAVRA